MRVIIQDDRGCEIANYSTAESEAATGPRFTTQNAICITALAEMIGFLSPEIEAQEVCLAVEAMPRPAAPH